MPSLPNLTSTLASPSQNVDSNDNDASKVSNTNSNSENLIATQVIKEPKKAKQPKLPPIWENERNLEEPKKKGEGNLPPLLVKEVLVWRDFEHAWRYIEKNRENVQF